MAFVPVPNTLKGFGVTLKQVFRKPITQQYPEYKRPVYPRYRGRHRLNRHENGLEKCVGCSLCAAACPALACPFDAITLGNEFEISEHNRDDLIYTKDILLAEPIKKVPVADRDLYDTPIPYYKDHS
jgi:NADH-quinone oxidoreductase subunit I